MKKAFVILLITVLTLALTLTAGAEKELHEYDVLRENADYGGEWEVDGNNYVCHKRMDWPDFGFYSLGNTDQRIKMYAELTVASKTDEPDGKGGDSGFMICVSDVNQNGLIEENEDNYYLIALSSSEDGCFLGVERNEGGWGGWGEEYGYTGFEVGDVVGLTVIYDPAEAYFEVYVTEFDENGEGVTDDFPWLEWGDDKPLEGLGYGICSKITDGPIRNVSVATGENAGAPSAAESQTDALTEAPTEKATEKADTEKQTEKAPETNAQSVNTEKADTKKPSSGNTDPGTGDKNNGTVTAVIIAACAVAAAGAVTAVILILKKKRK